MNLFALADDTILAMFRDFLAVLKELLTPVLLGLVSYYLAKIKSTAKDATEVIKNSAAAVVTKIDDNTTAIDNTTAATEVTNNLLESKGATRGN